MPLLPYFPLLHLSTALDIHKIISKQQYSLHSEMGLAVRNFEDLSEHKQLPELTEEPEIGQLLSIALLTEKKSTPY